MRVSKCAGFVVREWWGSANLLACGVRRRWVGGGLGEGGRGMKAEDRGGQLTAPYMVHQTSKEEAGLLRSANTRIYKSII